MLMDAYWLHVFQLALKRTQIKQAEEVDTFEYLITEFSNAEIAESIPMIALASWIATFKIVKEEETEDEQFSRIIKSIVSADRPKRNSKNKRV